MILYCCVFLCCYPFLGEWRSVFTQCTAYDFNSIRLPTCLVTCWYLVARIVTWKRVPALSQTGARSAAKRASGSERGGVSAGHSVQRWWTHVRPSTMWDIAPSRTPAPHKKLHVYVPRQTSGPGSNPNLNPKVHKICSQHMNWPEQADPVIYTALLHRRIW